jgi:hypothetical protein
MTIRRFPSSQSPDVDTVPVRSMPWWSVASAVSTATLCGAVFAIVSAQPGQGLPNVNWIGGAKVPSLSEAFGTPPLASGDPRRSAKFLPGIGGQTFAPAARQNALAEGETLQILPNVAPVAWDRLSAGDCMTVTAKSGQTFSFRILGARPSGKPDQGGDLAKIELAVSACADMGEPVAKAVIQPTTPPAPKGTSAERSL